MKASLKFDHAVLEIRRECTGNLVISIEEYEQYKAGNIDLTDIIIESWGAIEWDENEYEVTDHRYEH